jgi:hypothetical protein
MTMSAKRLVIVCVSVLMLLASPSAQACGLLDWFCGCSSSAAPQSTYAPAYVPTAVVPASGCAAPAAQTTYYAPTVAVATPVTTYRPFLPLVPRPTTTYYRPSGYNPYSLAPVTVYRPVAPVQPVVTTTRLIPYTSYRMAYPTTVSYYGVVPTYYAAPAYAAPPAACAVPESLAVPSYDLAPAGPASEGDANEAPSLPPGQPSTTYYPPLESPSTIVVEKPYYNPTPASETRQENKPVTPNEPKPAPQDESKKSGTDDSSTKSASPTTLQHNSLPAGRRDDSQDRTTMRPIRQVSRQTTVASQTSVRVLSNDAWRPATD